VAASSNRTVLCLLGPTASGKTDLAIALARQRPTDLVSVDSAMVYRGMDIGTAKPDARTLEQHPHALIDIREPHEVYSAAAFVEDAQRCIEAAFAADRMPILVGGTMLYFKALLEGLADLPESSPALRQKLQGEAQRHGLAAMYQRLQAVDPVAAERIDSNNSQRLLRALEVYEHSGVPISRFWAEQHAQGLAERLDCQPRCVALIPPRPLIHQRIAHRFNEMLDAGLLREVEALRQREQLHEDLPSMRAVGYRQAWQHLEGLTSESEMIERALAATRQLAKRQLTWLRGWPDLHTIDPSQQDAAAVALQYLDTVAIVP
jgi:tRNA dimethylallyltransferase